MSRARARRSEGKAIPVQDLINNLQQSSGYDGGYDRFDADDFGWSANDSWSQADSYDTEYVEQDYGAPFEPNSPAAHHDSHNQDFGWESDQWWAPQGDYPPRPVEPAAEPVVATPIVPARKTQQRKPRRGGAHRLPAPPAALKGRAAVVAVAAGAVVAAGQNAFASIDKPAANTVEFQAVGQAQALPGAPDPAATPGQNPEAPQLLSDSGPANVGQFNDMLDNGAAFAQELAAKAEAQWRPLFVKFTSGTFTSGYGARWGVLHPGVDVAAPIGTPIVAVEDGTVIDAGPAEGFGMWVRVLGDDGTITVYGHVNTATVSVGQHVTAGDQIATVGNRGESTGPHCHFEVWLNGTNRIDPLPWLATRGISLGPERD
ncbi:MULTISPECIES: M23 family metallopeptidase [unclassified Nocardia]|uniref:M23 family metallopeptidase n=1 Tax=unclassified Nocardia TaxID=2637762 RepID=UPI001CE4245A|nr:MULTISPECIES: M23 family metallopeptidase [unclassified Nocardia]